MLGAEPLWWKNHCLVVPKLKVSVLQNLLHSVLSFLSSGVVFEYLSAVLSDVLHCQREPLPLCLALLQYDKELASSEPSASSHPSIIHLHQYYSKWLPQQCREELVSF